MKPSLRSQYRLKVLFFKPPWHFFFSHSRLHHTHVELKLPISESNPK